MHKEMGLVAQVFDEPSLTALRGDIAVAHCRYSTTGAPIWANAQPTFRSTPVVSIALGHNGNPDQHPRARIDARRLRAATPRCTPPRTPMC